MASTGRNAISTANTSHPGKMPALHITTRPATHSSTRASRPRPCRGGAPVQLHMAVSRKPAIAAGTSPISISWACHCMGFMRSEEHTSELQSRENLVCRLLLEKKKNVILNRLTVNESRTHFDL